ncbi:hypothetical protein [Flavobacterium sp. SM2513]|uniref:hypothetical protein n=1 Tax=Flavobacterium sp. SM2513 TaxID=3424766 RepID=UPI003D7FC1BB
MKKQITYWVLLLVAVFLQFNVQAQAGAPSIVAGDIAFIGYNTDSPDGFAFIVLNDLPAGQTLYFTDEGWTGSAWGNQSEVHLSWVIPSGATRGTIVSVVETSPDTFTVTGASNGVTLVSGSSFSLSAGDQIMAYQSAWGVRPSAPTFIAAIHGDYSDFNYNSTTHWNTYMTVGISAESVLPTGLTNGVNCIAINPAPGPEYDNAKYTGTLTGTVSAIRALINNPANWSLSSLNNFSIVTSDFSTANISCPVAVSPAVITNVKCNGAATGAITVMGTGSNLTYEWTPSNITGNGTNVVTGLVAGVYKCTVSNDCGSASLDIIITEPSALSAGISATSASCNGSSDGMASVSVSGGTTPYTYLWSNNATTASVYGLGGINYSVLITDGKGCTLTKNINVGQPANAVSGTITVVQALTSASSQDGWLAASGSGGTPGYTYEWSNFATTAQITGIGSGTYGCTITDVNGCSKYTEYTLSYNAPAPVAYAVTGGGTTCAGGTGATIGLANSQEGVTYQVQLASTNVGDAVAGTGEALSLGNFVTAGTYTVVAKNTVGTLTTAMTGSASVSTPSYIVLVEEPATACAGTSVAITGTTGSLSNFTGAFAPENWTTTNTDTNGNVNTANAPASIIITSGNNGSSFPGTTDYSIVVPASGTLSFNWNYTTNDGPEWDYPQIVYNSVISYFTDFNESGADTQSGFETIEVVAGETFVLRMYTQDNSGPSGIVTISNFSVVSSATGTPSYAWTASNGGVLTGATDGLTATATTAGTYTLTATVDGCTFSDDVVVPYFDAIEASAIVTNISCNGASDGFINLTPSGGTADYTFDWGGDITTEDRIGLSAGNYSVTITDANGCTASQSFTITEPTILVASGVIDAEMSSYISNDAAVTANASGGTAPYTYLWSNEATTASISGLNADTYICIITDANGCTASVELDIVYVPTTPLLFSVVGGGPVCAGSSVSIGLSYSQTNVSYQLKRGSTAVGDAVIGIGSAFTFGNFTETGIYTVVGTRTDNQNSATMSGSANITDAAYVMVIAEPEVTCMSTSVTLNASTGSIEDFTGVFGPEHWTLTNDNANGYFDTDGLPDYLVIMGGDGTSPIGEGNTDYSTTVPVSGILTFHWNYFSEDNAANDLPQIVYNGVASTLNGYNTNFATQQSGTVTMHVEEGATLALRMHKTANGSGAAGMAISNWKVASSLIGTPTLSWTASNGGVIEGTTSGLEIEAASSGTYTLTATLGNCSFSESVTVDLNNPTLITTIWNGTAWSNEEPHIGVKAIIDGDLIVNEALEACELVITENGSLTVQSGAYTGVIGKVTNNAAALNFVVENNGVLVQLKEVQNEGPVTVNVNSFPLYRQDYTLWSSPVMEQNLRSFSPQTLFNRFSSYNPSLGTVGEYVQEIFTTQDVVTKEFAAANGYLIRMPNNWAEYVDAATPGVSYGGVFKGVPQNGTISLPLSTTNSGMNLTGNPYPSPIIISAFFGSNPNIEQTIYYWRKRNGAAGTGYATYNNMGFVTLQPGLSAIETAIESAPAINPGQGFFVKSLGATQLTFTNEMRYFQSNGVFLRQETPELHRFKLNLSNATAVVGQTLIGYTAAATAGVDNGFDSSYFNDSSTALTSLINGSEYIIQGLGLPFDVTSSVALGFKTETAGAFSISLGAFDGFFAEGQNIYLKDNVTGLVHNVKESAYSFTANEGIANDRFEVVYQNSTLGTNNPDLDINKVMVYKEGQDIVINAMTMEMQKVELYDIRGSLIQVLDNVKATTATFSKLNIANQVVLVKITSVDNKVTTKKIVF